ncbi:MAG: diguanylate cyclase (GGDEF)-like protein [Enterobacterales bacterium]|jgi:diguanylate cyclase (GGDEF)-like protein
MEINMPRNIIQVSYIGGTISDFENIAEIIQSINIPAKLNHIKTSPKLLQEIENNQCVLIIGKAKKTGFDVFKALSTINSNKYSIPVIGLYDPGSGKSVAEAMDEGLNDYVEFSNSLHLKLVIQRELNYLELIYHGNSLTKILALDFTSLYSRLQFIDYLESVLPQRVANSEYSALLYVQLDNFSWINESIGIESGDIFLKDTAKVIKSMLDENDVAARYQGGSFIMLVSAITMDKLNAKADMLREAISIAVTEIGTDTISSSCSIGIRLLEDDEETTQEVISHSFEASDSAKANGGDSVHLYKIEDKPLVVNQSNNAWDARIREAFDNDLFQLYFQPIVSLRGDSKPRYEVLLRMIDGDGNIISPGTFLPSAERAGLMADIDRWVILHSFEKALEQQKKGSETEVFIKLSGKSLDDTTMPSWIRNTIKDFDINNNNIVFEITESLALSHLSQTRRLVDNLKQLNCKIAIDHFGRRLKSFKLLDLLEIDYLKVEESLVVQLQTNKAHQTIVKKIFRESSKANIQIMAAAIQEVNSLPIIWQYGFHFVQGYFLQIPDQQMEYDFSNLLI